MTDESPSEPTELTRRQVMKALAAAAVCPFVASCEFANVYDENGDPDVEESSFSLHDDPYAGLQQIGGKACHDHGGEELLLVRVSDDEIAAFDRICPHQFMDMGECDGEGGAAQASWDEDENTITCLWHGSRFDLDGAFLGSDMHSDDVPDLPTFPVDFDPDTGEGSVFSE